MNHNQYRQEKPSTLSSSSSTTMTMNQDQHRCTNSFHTQDKANLSRRSIDWRDSGIVIDEDNHLFHSFESIYNFDSRPFIESTNAERERPNKQSSLQSPTPQTCSIRDVALSQDEDGDSLLHLAVVGFTLDKVKDLIGLCDLNAINNMMQTSLHVATLANRPEMVQLLISSGAKLNVYDRRGNTPLHLACQKGLTCIVEIILDAIPTVPHHDGISARDQAIKSCNFEGFTCLHLAAMNGQNKIIELLVSKYQTDLSVRDSKSGETILHKAIRHFNIGLVEFILKQTQHNIISAADYSGRMPHDTIRILLEEPSVVVTENQDHYSKLQTIKHLIESGVRECAARGGCCIGRSLMATESASLSASSSSDYSDSD
jgi:ankyrin repeat protein